MAVSWVLKPQHRNRIKFQRFMPWWHAEQRRELAEKKEREAAEEKKRLEDEARRLEEEQRRLEEERIAEEERLRVAEERKVAAIKEAKRRIEKEKLKAEEKRLTEMNRQRLLQSHMKSEAQRAAEVSRRRAENEKKRKEEERYRLEAKQVAEELKKKMEEEKRIIEEEIARLAGEKYKLEQGRAVAEDESNLKESIRLNKDTVEAQSDCPSVKPQNNRLEQNGKNIQADVAGIELFEQAHHIKDNSNAMISCVIEEESSRKQPTLEKSIVNYEINSESDANALDKEGGRKENYTEIVSCVIKEKPTKELPSVIQSSLQAEIHANSDPISPGKTEDCNKDEIFSKNYAEIGIADEVSENIAFVNADSIFTVVDTLDTNNTPFAGVSIDRHREEEVLCLPQQRNSIVPADEIVGDSIKILVVANDKQCVPKFCENNNIVEHELNETVTKYSEISGVDDLGKATKNNVNETPEENVLRKDQQTPKIDTAETGTNTADTAPKNVKSANIKTVNPAVKKMHFTQNCFSPTNVVKNNINKLDTPTVDINLNIAGRVSPVSVAQSANVAKTN